MNSNEITGLGFIKPSRGYSLTRFCTSSLRAPALRAAVAGVKSWSLAVPLLLQQLKGHLAKGSSPLKREVLGPGILVASSGSCPADPCSGRTQHVEIHTSIPQPKAVFTAACSPNFIYFYCLLIRNWCVQVATTQQRGNDWL